MCTEFHAKLRAIDYDRKIRQRLIAIHVNYAAHNFHAVFITRQHNRVVPSVK